MKRKVKLFASLLALFMALGVFAPVLKAVNTIEEKTSKDPNAKTQSVTLHKLLMTKEELTKWDSDKVEEKGYDATQNLQELNVILQQLQYNNATEIAGVYFVWEKEDTDGTWKPIKKNGEFATAPTGEGKTVYDDSDILGGLTTSDGIKFDTKNLPAGQYRISEVKEKSTYSKDGAMLTGSKAVPVVITMPLVNKDGIVLNAHVYPKNTEDKPQIDKNFAKSEEDDYGADYINYNNKKAKISALIGTNKKFEVKSKIPQNAEYKTIKWEDIMTKGLTYNEDLNIEIKRAAVEGETGDQTLTLTNTTDYDLTQNQSGFKLILKESGLTKMAELAKKGDVTVTLTYSAKINSSAVVDVPDENKISFKVDNKPTKEEKPKETKTNNNEIKVEKSWEENQAPSNVEVTYFLFEKGANGAEDKVVASVTKKSPDFNHTFTGLDNNKNYYVKEIVRGYDPSYISAENGTITIKNTKSPNGTPLVPTSPKIVTYGKKFVKTNDETPYKATRLAGAEFLIYKKDGNNNQYLALKDDTAAATDKSNYEAAETKYNKAILDFNKETKKDGYDDNTVKITVDQAEITGKTAILAKINELKADRDKKFLKAREQYEWTTDKSKALVLTSDLEGRFEITGLPAGTYYLEEKKAPEGYAKINDQDFQVGENTYSSHTNGISYNKEGNSQDAQQVKNKKVTIPQTGGIGTLIFTVTGIMLMAGAAFAIKRRKDSELAEEI